MSSRRTLCPRRCSSMCHDSRRMRSRVVISVSGVTLMLTSAKASFFDVHVQSIKPLDIMSSSDYTLRGVKFTQCKVSAMRGRRSMYDAIVLGARVAGSPTAMLLARKGYRVLLVDRATFPSDTMSTHQVQIPGSIKLKRWGLLDAVLETGLDVAHHVQLCNDDVVVKGTFPSVDGLAGVYSPRRYLLDNILARAAVAAGAELREGFVVRELLWDEGRVVGMLGEGRNGTTI